MAARRAPALRLENVSFRYRGAHTAGPTLRDVSLTVRSGETVVLMGPNGSGKTTVLRIAAGLVRPSGGRVTLGSGSQESEVLAPRGDVGYIPQQLGLLRNRTVEQNVLLGCLGRGGPGATLVGRFPSAEVEAAHHWIESVGLAQKTQHKLYRLSGGERQRVAIARALLQHPKVLLADEFVSNLDPMRAREILRMARRRLAEERAGMLVALHNLDLARRVADRFVFLREGSVVADLPAARVTEGVVERHLKG